MTDGSIVRDSANVQMFNVSSFFARLWHGEFNHGL